MPIYYGSNSLIPSPYVAFSKRYETDDTGKRVGTLWNIVLKGKITADKGSPNSSGVFWTQSGNPPDESIPQQSRLAAILRKQEAIRRLFNSDGQVLTIQPWDGAPPVTFNPRVKGIDFAEGPWFQTCDYTVTLEADRVYLGGGATDEDPGLDNYYVSKAGEEWHIEPADPYARTYRLSHTVQATGKRFFDVTGALVKEAWQNARDYVLAQLPLGMDSEKLVAAGVLNLSTFGAYNYIRQQNVNEGAGTFQVIETWLCFDPNWTPDGIAPNMPAIEELNVTVRVSTEDAKTHVSVEGTITGLEQRDPVSYAPVANGGRWANASSKWVAVQPFLKQRAESFSATAMNAVPLVKQSAFNEGNGIITYHYEYDNRPTPTTPNALSEIVTVVNHYPTDVFAIVPVLGRAIGPVLQGIGTVKEARIDLVVEIVMPAQTNRSSSVKPNTIGFLATYVPVAGQIFKERDDESWNVWTGRYSRSVTWVYQ
jgi:hypothetical protein